MTKRRRQPEAELQRALCKLLDHAVRPGVIWFAVPNGGARSKTEAAIMAGLGVHPGVLDLAFILPPHGRIGMLELKAKGIRIRKGSDQDKMRIAILEAGGLADEANTLEKAVDVLNAWEVLKTGIHFQ